MSPIDLLIQYDDLFLYSPSFLIGEEAEQAGHVFEGKAIGTAALADISLKQVMQELVGPQLPNYAKERKTGQTVGKRKLKDVQARARTALLVEIGRFEAGATDATTLKASAAKLMKMAWRDVFLAGVRASGKPPTLPGSKALVHLSPGDDKWLKGAMAHEVRFLNSFMRAVVGQTYKMALDQRVEMYVRSLESFFDNARVIGMPPGTLIHWTGPWDDRSCPGCNYMFKNNPYTKYTLPTVPRAGMTQCLTNCRDRLLLRRVGAEAAAAAVEGKKTRQQHVGALRRLKRKKG